MTVRSCGRDDLPDVLMPGLDREVAGQLHVRPEVTHKLDL